MAIVNTRRYGGMKCDTVADYGISRSDDMPRPLHGVVRMLCMVMMLTSSRWRGGDEVSYS